MKHKKTANIIDFDATEEKVSEKKEELSGREWWISLSSIEKREIENLQTELFEAGFGQDTPFWQKTCLDEAIKRMKAKWKQ